ncbi:MAG: thiamine phosphate synthase [Hyphomicrobiales bacterium]|nr:thiamine phosphate synthase [Hyphomicrobiales bacterium]
MDRTCELYLRIDGDDLPSIEWMEEVIRTSSPAAILFGRALLEKAGTLDRLDALVACMKRQEIAVLFEDNTALATRLKADGVHLNDGVDNIEQVRESLGEDAYIGVASPMSRHDAISLGEAGVSYVAFGGGNGAAAVDFDALAEITQWWGDIVELPCVVRLGPEADERQMRELIEAGADYLAPDIRANADTDRLALISNVMKSVRRTGENG